MRFYQFMYDLRLESYMFSLQWIFVHAQLCPNYVFLEILKYVMSTLSNHVDQDLVEWFFEAIIINGAHLNGRTRRWPSIAHAPFTGDLSVERRNFSSGAAGWNWAEVVQACETQTLYIYVVITQTIKSLHLEEVLDPANLVYLCSAFITTMGWCYWLGLRQDIFLSINMAIMYKKAAPRIIS